jgi:hypothetical protein
MHSLKISSTYVLKRAYFSVNNIITRNTVADPIKKRQLNHNSTINSERE